METSSHYKYLVNCIDQVADIVKFRANLTYEYKKQWFVELCTNEGYMGFYEPDINPLDTERLIQSIFAGKTMPAMPYEYVRTRIMSKDWNRAGVLADMVRMAQVQMIEQHNAWYNRLGRFLFGDGEKRKRG